MESCGPPAMSPAFPEVLEATAELGAAESDDGVDTGDGPMHAGALAADADGGLATGFDDTGRGTESGRVELVVAHTGTIGVDVFDALFGFGMVRLASEGRQQGWEVAGVEFLVTSLLPLLSEWAVGAVDGFGYIPEVPLA